MEDKEKKTPKFMIISVLIVILLTGIGVAFGYFIWNSNATLRYVLGTKLVESLDDGSNGDLGSGVYKVHHDGPR